MFRVWHIYQTHAALSLDDRQTQVLWASMFAKPTLFWTWLMVKFKFIGSNMFVRPHYLGLGWLPSSSSLSLVCLSNLRYLGFGWLPSPSSLSLSCLPDPRYLGLGWMSSQSHLDLTCLPDLNYLELSWLLNSSSLGLTYFSNPFYLIKIFFLFIKILTKYFDSSILISP